jgi:hypothetical protein
LLLEEEEDDDEEKLMVGRAKGACYNISSSGR